MANSTPVLGIPVAEIQSRVGVSEGMVRYAHRNLMMYGSARPPRFRALGKRGKLTLGDRAALFSELCEHGWVDQAEMVY
jgi:hypothetical protein